MSQADTTLQLLRSAGTRGIHSLELRTQHHIGNPSQRIAELEAAGMRIDHARERSPYGTDAWGTRYTLAAEPEQRVTVPPPDLDDNGFLQTAGPTSPYTCWD